MVFSVSIPYQRVLDEPERLVQREKRMEGALDDQENSAYAENRDVGPRLATSYFRLSSGNREFVRPKRGSALLYRWNCVL